MMQTKQEHVDISNWSNETVLIIVLFVSVLQPNTKFYLSKRYALCGECSYIKENYVYINIKHGKTVK